MTTTARPGSIPGPAAARPFGRRANLHRYTSDPVAYTAALHHRFGPVSGLIKGDTRHVFAFGSANNRAVLTAGDTFHTVFEYATPAGVKAARRGIGLLNMNGPEHAASRRSLTPPFRTAAVMRQSDRIAALASDEIGAWPSGIPFDLHRRARDLTLRIACDVLFGVDVAERSGEIGDLVQRMLSLRYFASSIRYFPFDVPGTPYHRLLSVIRRLDTSLEHIIEQRRSSPDAPDDILSCLITSTDESGTPLSTDQLIGHLNTLLVAGHETSSSTLSWAFVLLDQHPEIAAALVDEVASVPGGGDDRAATLMDLPLLDRVIKEVLRLLPPGPNTTRIATAPLTIGGYHVEPGAQVVTSKYVSHRDPVIFTDPLRFRPDRWLDIEPSVFEYLPFGVGPHVCIGATFATLEMKIVIAEILRRGGVRLVAGSDISRDVGMMMSPKHGVPVLRGTGHGRPTRVNGDIHQMVHLEDARTDRLGW